MTTREFIEKTYGVESDKERRCSSVFTDNDGTVYSYGYHYPLAFNLRGLDFINTAGYSTTTIRHICWAWAAIGYHSIGVKLSRGDAQVIASIHATVEEKLKVIQFALEGERDDLCRQLLAKKRKDTKVYQNLSDRYAKAIENINQVLRAL